MSAHTSWELICRLFAGGTPVFRSTLTAPEQAACDALGSAIKATVISQSSILCPTCHQHSGLIERVGIGGRICHCPECGPVKIATDDLAAIRLDENWLQRQLRRALDIQSHDGVTKLVDGIWRLGDMRSDPVVLSRSVLQVALSPNLLDRVRVSRGDIRVIAPQERGLREAPFPPGVTWLPLEERFTYFGGKISFVEPGTRASESVDPTAPVHGPFSEDFTYVTIPGTPYPLVELTATQAAIMRLLWSYQGKKIAGSEIMRRVKAQSTKPIDVFKIKSAQKGIVVHEGRHFAYRALVKADNRGMHWMPCAATA